jgi:hypothetical protein
MKLGVMQPPVCAPSPPLMSAGPPAPRALLAPDPRLAAREPPGLVSLLWSTALVLGLVELVVHASTTAAR